MALTVPTAVALDLWKTNHPRWSRHSEKDAAISKTGHALGQPGRRSSFIDDPGAEFFPQRKKKKQKERNARNGTPVETAAALEIDKGGLRQLLLDDFHRCLEKPKTTSAFPQLPQARRRLTKTLGTKNRKQRTHSSTGPGLSIRKI